MSHSHLTGRHEELSPDSWGWCHDQLKKQGASKTRAEKAEKAEIASEALGQLHLLELLPCKTS